MDRRLGWRLPAALVRGSSAREPRLRRLLAVQSCVSAADAMFTVSLAGSLFFAVSVDAARSRILTYLLFTLAPFAVVGPFIAPIVDRAKGGHRAVIAVAALLRTVACLVLAGSLDTLLFFPAAFAVLVLGKTTSVARSALLPRLLDDGEHLVLANALVSRFASLGGMAGGIVGALLLQLVGAPAAVLGAAVGYVASAVVAFRLAPVAPPLPGERALAELAELADARLALAAAAQSMVRFSAGFVTFHTAFALKQDRQPTWIFGVVLLTGTVSVFLASLVGPRLRRRVGEDALLRAAAVVIAVAAVLAAGQRATAGALLVTAAVSVAGAVAQQAFASLVQRLAPDAELGRAFARFDARFQVVWVVGAVGPVLLRPPRPLGYVVVGVTIAAFAVASGLLDRSARARRSAEPAAPDQACADASLLALAHALAAQGDDRLAVLTAVEAARVHLTRTRAGSPLSPDLQRAWTQAAGGGAPPVPDAVIAEVERLTGWVRPSDGRVTEP